MVENLEGRIIDRETLREFLISGDIASIQKQPKTFLNFITRM